MHRTLASPCHVIAHPSRRRAAKPCRALYSRAFPLWQRCCLLDGNQCSVELEAKVNTYRYLVLAVVFSVVMVTNAVAGANSYGVLSLNERIECLKLLTQFGIEWKAVANVCDNKPCDKGVCIVTFQSGDNQSGYRIGEKPAMALTSTLRHIERYTSKVANEGKRPQASWMTRKRMPIVGGSIFMAAKSRNRRDFYQAIAKLKTNIVPQMMQRVTVEMMELSRFTRNAQGVINSQKGYHAQVFQIFGCPAGGCGPNSQIAGTNQPPTAPTAEPTGETNVNGTGPTGLLGQQPTGVSNTAGTPNLFTDGWKPGDPIGSQASNSGKPSDQNVQPSKPQDSSDNLSRQLRALGLQDNVIETVLRVCNGSLVAGDSITVIDMNTNIITIIPTAQAAGGAKGD